MVSGLKFVTAVVALVSGMIFMAQSGCTGHMRTLRQSETRLAEMQRIKAELGGAYLIDLDGANTGSKDTSPVTDEHVRALLKRFVQLSEDVLRLDDQKGVAVTGRERIEAERDTAKRLLAAPVP